MTIAGIDYLVNSPIDGSGQSVIFLHGIGGGAQSFSAQLAQLTNFNCIAWNMPGYGASSSGTWPPTFASLSNSLHDFIVELGLERVHLVGQSIGGMLAIEHAIRQPDQVGSLSLIATTPSFGGRDDSFKHAFLKARLAPLDSGQSMAQVAAISAPKLVGPIASAQCISDIEAILRNVSEKTWRGILECLVTFNRRNDLASISQPCCLIAGSHDQNAPAKTMQKMSEKLSNAQFNLIEGAGHMVNQEAAARTNDILEHFLRQQSP